MKKKIIFLILAIFLLSSCKIKDIQKSGDKNQFQEKNIKSEEKIDNEKAEKIEKNQNQIFVDIQDEEDYQKISGGRVSIETAYSKIRLGRYEDGQFKEQEAMENLKKSLLQLNEDIKKDVEEPKKERLKDSYSRDEQFVFKNIIRLYNAGDKVLSLSGLNYDYYSGTHPQYLLSGYNYDVKTGQLIDIKDVLTDLNGFCKIFKEEFQKKYPKLDTFMDVEEYAKIFDFAWNIDSEKLLIRIPPREIAPYVAGTLEIEINFEKYKDLVKDKYKNKKNENYIKDVTGNESIEVDIPKIGKKILKYSQKNIPDYDAIESYTINYAGEDKKVETYSYETRRYLIKQGEDMYFAVTLVLENALGIIDLYKLEDKLKPVYKDYGFSGTLVQTGLGNTDPENILIHERCNILTSFEIYNYYHIDNEGLKPNSDVYYYYKGPGSIKERDKVLTLIKDIKVSKVDIEGNVLEEKNLKSGTNLTILRTDKTSYVDLMNSESEIYRFKVSDVKGDYTETVEGQNSRELFQGVDFVG